MNASVVVPTHNRRAVLARVLRLYGLQKLDVERFEVVVVDDGSTDDTPSLFAALKTLEPRGGDPTLERHKGRILELRGGQLLLQTPDFSPKPLHLTYARIAKSGRSVARNIGIALAAAPLIIFADDDIFVEPEFVRKHLAVHLFNRRCVVTGRVIHTGSLEDPFSARWKLKDLNTACLATGNASVLKHAVVEAGMFDEGYTVYGWEDFDLGIHLKEHGLRSIRRPICGYHYEPSAVDFDPAEVYRKEKERGMTAVYFYKNHPLRWVKRFTLVESRAVRALVALLGRNNWFFEKHRIRRFGGVAKLIVRYKGYFDGIAAGKERYLIG